MSTTPDSYSNRWPIWTGNLMNTEPGSTFSKAVLWQCFVTFTQIVNWKRCVLRRIANRYGTSVITQLRVRTCSKIYCYYLFIVFFFFLFCLELLKSLEVEYVEEVSHTLWDPMEIIDSNAGTAPLTYDMFIVGYVIESISIQLIKSNSNYVKACCHVFGGSSKTRWRCRFDECLLFRPRSDRNSRVCGQLIFVFH